MPRKRFDCMRLNWLAYKFIGVDGYGRFNLGFVRSLIRAGVEVYPDTVDILEFPHWFSRARGLDLGNLTIQCMPVHEMKPIGGRNVAYTMWEAHGVPKHLEQRDGTIKNWISMLNEIPQQVLVPCNWFKESLEEQGVKTPIYVIPGGIDPIECPILPDRTAHRPFTFGCWGDRGNRKGMDLVWMAFFKAFGTSRDVRLLIKCRPGSLPFLDLTHSDNRISMWKEDTERISDVFANIDCLVFPTRGEGFGMPPREASACGIPTIVTNWSGTADDIEKWAFPLNKFEMGVSPLPEDGIWANPNVDEIVEKMKWVYENYKEARSKALEHAQWLRDNLTWDHSTAKLIDFVKFKT